MAKTPTEVVEEQQATEQLEDMKETKDAQAAADAGVSGPEKQPGDPGFKTIEDDPELLGKLQEPHKDTAKQPEMIWHLNAYGKPVLAPR